MDESTMLDSVAVARIEGKLGEINLRLEYMTKNVDLGNQRLNAHSDRITKLEQAQTAAKGERDGVDKVVKVLWAILAVMLTGGILTVGAIVAFVAGVFK